MCNSGIQGSMDCRGVWGVPFLFCLFFLLSFFQMKQNSQDIKLTIFKSIIPCHSAHSQCSATITSIYFQTFSSLRKKPLYPLSSYSPSPHPLSLWIYLLWIFHIQRILPYVILYDWLLSFRIMFLRFAIAFYCGIFWGFVSVYHSYPITVILHMFSALDNDVTL